MGGHVGVVVGSLVGVGGVIAARALFGAVGGGHCGCRYVFGG